MMKQNRLELVLRRNHRSVVLDLFLAVFFALGATSAGITMNGALRQLTGAPVALATSSETAEVASFPITACVAAALPRKSC
jgi:hypothetical protein